MYLIILLIYFELLVNHNYHMYHQLQVELIYLLIYFFISYLKCKNNSKKYVEINNLRIKICFLVYFLLRTKCDIVFVGDDWSILPKLVAYIQPSLSVIPSILLISQLLSNQIQPRLINDCDDCSIFNQPILPSLELIFFL